MSNIASEIKKSFASRIRAVRKKLRLSQEQAAKDWGFSLETLRAWEYEKRNPYGLYREKLERILNRLE
jgi:DNA-binding transcriptional regulator YiaG